jgi:hypothetical protein
MNRLYFAAWSLDLQDDEFAQALASLGVLAAVRHLPGTEVGNLFAELPEIKEQFLPNYLAQLFAAVHRDNDLLAWRFSPPTSQKHSAVSPQFSAAILAEAWRQFLTIITGEVELRLALLPKGAVLGALLTCARVLQHPAVRASSVIVTDMFPSDACTEWRWPVTIATLPGDPLAASFEAEQEKLPTPWPYCFTVADRDHARAEILVCSGSLRDTLATVIADRVRRRAALVLLIGGVGPETSTTPEPLFLALAAVLSAEGVAIIEPYTDPLSANLLIALRKVADVLAHNREIDVALQTTFGASITLLANRNLLRLSRLGNTVNDLSLRLKRLPSKTKLTLSVEALTRFHLPSDPMVQGTTRAIRPGDLAASLDQQATSFKFLNEGQEAAALTEVTQEVSINETQQLRRTESARYIQHRMFRKARGEFIEEYRSLEVGVPVMLTVRLGPPDHEWCSAPEEFPDHLLPTRPKHSRLHIVFYEPDQMDRPLSGQILLPQKGASNEATFTFTPRKVASFQGRITVLHRGRVLQTALVHAAVCEAGSPENCEHEITQQIETRVRSGLSDLDSRRAFDLALVLNHTAAERPILTAVSSRRAWARGLSGIEDPVARINSELSNVANSVADYSKGLLSAENEALFVRLARIGANMYSHLFIDDLEPTQTENLKLSDEEYIQIICTKADAIVPLEFLYQFPPPKKDGAKICPHSVDALKNIPCPPPCNRLENPTDYVCPLGFWGLSKVIERHVYNPKIAMPEVVDLTVQAEPMEHRDRLNLDHGAVLGFSKEVPDAKVTDMIELLKKKFKGKVEVADNWDGWRTAVKTNTPTMLVAFPHNQGSEEDIELEIRNDYLGTTGLSTDFVHVAGSPFPLVILLGCDVAGTDQQYASHVANFRRAGAAVVVSTIATVFGEHAVAVGEMFICRLLDPVRTKNSRLGELLRDVKREAVAESLPMALCVVAFGDADWRL